MAFPANCRGSCAPQPGLACGCCLQRFVALQEFDRLAYGFAVAADADQQDRISKALILLEGVLHQAQSLLAHSVGAFIISVVAKKNVAPIISFHVDRIPAVCLLQLPTITGARLRICPHS